jgi:glycosyltransferase involved in cell wall biosynthesis
VVFWTDAEFDSYVDAYYSAVERGALANFDDGARQEAAALTNCSMAIYASAWAARHVAARWPQFVDKLAVIPFGENLEKVPSRADVDAAIAAKDMSECRLLFIGVDWRRKGGDRAVEFHAALCEAGCPSRLTIIGPAVQPDLEGLPGVVQLGFLRKDDATDAEVIGRELHRAHFLILPSRAEALGIVLVEAAAYGTPAITTAVGGIPEIIDDGVNGIVDDFADPVALAVRIKKIIGCKNLYTSMAKRSRDEFDERLSWSARIEQFDQEIHSGKIV